MNAIFSTLHPVEMSICRALLRKSRNEFLMEPEDFREVAREIARRRDAHGRYSQRRRQVRQPNMEVCHG